MLLVVYVALLGGVGHLEPVGELRDPSGPAWWGGATAVLVLPKDEQQGVVGLVVDRKTGQPLRDAVVTPSSGGAVRTNVRGEFSVPWALPVTVRVTRIGYRPVTAELTAEEPIRIALQETAVQLDAVVVTGTVGEQQRRAVGNAVGRIAVAENIVVAPPAKLQDMLSINVPGVRVLRASGAVGGGGTTRIRGAGSLSLSNEPLLYIDGVRVNNDAAANSAAFASGQERPSRINDLNPEEIESIEVLKGPSAATIYGTEASNGVIQVITKRGRAGRNVVDVHLEAGANWFADPEGRYQPNYYYSQRTQQIEAFSVLDFRRARGFDPIFSTGTPLAAGAALSGGSDRVRYYVSADVNRDEGYVHYNWQNKYSTRANLNYTSANDRFSVDVSFGAVRSKLRGASGMQPITASILWACIFPGCEPTGPDTTTTGWNSRMGGFRYYRPEDYDMVHAYDNVDRTTLSLRFTHRPTSWLRHGLTVGPDFTNVRGSRLIERDPSGFTPFGQASLGLKMSSHNRQTLLTVDYHATADWPIGKSLRGSTSVGAQYYHKVFDYFQGQGAQFAVPGPSNIGGGSQITASETYQENKTLGVFAQQQLSWRDRLFLTAAVRADDNSAFGSNFDGALYPKVSLSWVAREADDGSAIGQLRFRGAWGRAGQQPDVYSAIRSYQAGVGANGTAGVTPQNLGNPDLKPEVGEEIEFGFDASFLDQRVGLEVTAYRKRVRDAILTIPARPSRGFPGVQFQNIGATENDGLELALDLTPIRSRSVSLDLRTTLATNGSTITDMGDVPPTFIGAAYIQQWNVAGYAPGAYFYKRVTGSTIQTLPVSNVPLPVGMSPQCEGGTRIGASSLAVGDGSTVPCASAGALYAGRPTPSWSGSFSATLTLGQRLRLLGVIDGMGGHHVMVGDAFSAHMSNMNSRQILEGTDPILAGYLGLLLLQGDINSAGAVGLMKGGFARLRIVSASYDLPGGALRWLGASRGAITVAAENLALLWRAQQDSYGFRWIDPEILPNRSGNVPGLLSYTQESWPQAARIRTTLRLSF